MPNRKKQKAGIRVPKIAMNMVGGLDVLRFIPKIKDKVVKAVKAIANSTVVPVLKKTRILSTLAKPFRTGRDPGLYESLAWRGYGKRKRRVRKAKK